MKTIKILLTLLILTIGHIQATRLSPYVFKSYQVEDGLSHNTVWCGLQDRYGFIWLGTSDGLNRYSGNSNKVYKNELNNKFSIESNYIQALFELENGNLLVGTNRGLYLYNREKDHFIYFDKRTEFGVTISSEIKKIIKTPNGLLWIATMGQGLFIYDHTKDQLTQHSFYTAFVCDICPVDSGEIYLASLQDGLFCLNEEGELINKYRLRPESDDREDYKINCLLPVEKTIWIGINGNLLLRLNKEEGRIDRFNVIPPDVEAIQSLMEYDEKRIWVGTDDGLYEFDYTNHQIIRLDNKNMSDQSIHAMMKDEEGGIWVLTNLGGINYLAKSNKQFHIFTPVSPDGINGSEKVVGPFCEDANGNIWIGTRRGLYLFDIQSQDLKHFPLRQNQLKNYDIRTLLIDENKLWIGTSGAGVLVMDLITKNIKHYTYSQDIPNTICSNEILTIYKLKNGDIYLGTAWGMSRYDKQQDHFVTTTAVGMMISVVDLLEDHHGHLWLATSNSGVFRLHIGRGEWKHFHHDTSNPASILSNSIISLFEDSNGTMWFGTDGRGLCYFDSETESFINFDPDDSLLPNNVIYSIEEDASGDFWISGNGGLTRINPIKKLNPQKFTVRDGLQGNQFNFRSSLFSNGFLFFGGINGFNMFRPETFTSNEYIPPVYITDINFPYSNNDQIKNELVNLSPSLYTSKQITLPYTYNSFSLTFASLSYEASDNNRYSWIMHGVDKDWRQNTDMNTAFYTELPPGKYEFEVRGSNNDYLWNETSALLTIVITPPWWQSSIAYLVYTFLIAGLIYFLAWRWNKYVRTKYRQRMEDFQMSKEKEIYKSKINFFINLVHEIRTPLSLIKLPLEKLQEEEPEPKNERYLSVIDRNVNYLLNITNQLLDFQKMESGNFNFNLAPCNMNLLTAQIASQFIAPAELKGIRLKTDLPVGEIIAMTDEDKVTKILMNLISNAIKYAQSEIRIRLSASENQFSLAVSDDGIGIPTEEKEKIFETFYQIESGKSSMGSGIGLAFSKSLAQGMEGSLEVYDNLPGGSLFILSLPLEKVSTVFAEEKAENVMIPKEKAEEEEESDFKNRKFTLLLVEDNPDLLKLTSESMSRFFRVLKARNAEEALEILKEKSPDIIVSDVMMPGMNGMELCNKIKSDINTSHIPLILLTAKTTIEAKIEGFECGADAYLEKPFSVKQLRGQIENLLKLRIAYHKQAVAISATIPVIEEQGVLSQKDLEVMGRINEALEEHLSDENFSLDSLAEALHMSRSNFYRKMKALTGMPPNEYLRVIRLNKAAVLLKQNVRVSDICQQVGFSSSSYFAKCFKTHFGVLPRHYLESNSSQKEEEQDLDN